MDALIAEVKKRDALWNRRNALYKDRFSKENDWDLIATNIGIPKEDAKKKWRNLRDKFIKEFKRSFKRKSGYPYDIMANYTGPWKYFTSLCFLKDSIFPAEMDGWISLSSGEEIELKTQHEDVYNNSRYIETPTEIEASFIPHIKIFENPASSNNNQIYGNNKKRFHNHYKEQNRPNVTTRKMTFANKDDDIHILFFLSLVPYMRKIDCVQQLRVRSKFQKVLMHEMQTNLNSFAAGTSSLLHSDSTDASTPATPTISNNDTMSAEQDDSNN